MFNNNKKKLSNICILDNDNISNLNEKDKNINLENCSDNEQFELVINSKKKKKDKKKSSNICILDNDNISNLNEKDKNKGTPLQTVDTAYVLNNDDGNKLVDSNLNSNKVTNEDKQLYVHNFINYNFHKINRYLPVQNIELDYDTSESEYDDDFYD